MYADLSADNLTPATTALIAIYRHKLTNPHCSGKVIALMKNANSFTNNYTKQSAA